MTSHHMTIRERPDSRGMLSSNDIKPVIIVSYSDSVLVLNASYEILTSVSWERAVTLVVTGIAEIHDAYEGRYVHSSSLIVPFPKIIKLMKYIYVRATLTLDTATNKSILARDNYRCGYCSARAKTIDHVLPRSRGGKNTWINLISSCFSCNNFKADRTPEEAGMKLLWEPRVPVKDRKLQRHIWANLNSGIA